TVVDAKGVVLWMGRSSRLATAGQTMALVARDGGCSFPGCEHPPEWCERHHVVAWADGGATDLDNLTLLCRYHHRQFLARGWTCRMVDRLPTWFPPRWVDPEQRPLRHTRITTRHLVC
ncbi:HNH endonuclease signature motif containing protein, partial [Microlunatus flavus]